MTGEEGVHTLFTGQREKEKERKGERGRENEKEGESEKEWESEKEGEWERGRESCMQAESAGVLLAFLIQSVSMRDYYFYIK